MVSRSPIMVCLLKCVSGSWQPSSHARPIMTVPKRCQGEARQCHGEITAVLKKSQERRVVCDRVTPPCHSPLGIHVQVPGASFPGAPLHGTPIGREWKEGLTWDTRNSAFQEEILPLGKKYFPARGNASLRGRNSAFQEK